MKGFGEQMQKIVLTSWKKRRSLSIAVLSVSFKQLIKLLIHHQWSFKSGQESMINILISPPIKSNPDSRESPAAFPRAEKRNTQALNNILNWFSKKVKFCSSKVSNFVSLAYNFFPLILLYISPLSKEEWGCQEFVSRSNARHCKLTNPPQVRRIPSKVRAVTFIYLDSPSYYVFNGICDSVFCVFEVCYMVVTWIWQCRDCRTLPGQAKCLKDWRC